MSDIVQPISTLLVADGLLCGRHGLADIDVILLCGYGLTNRHHMRHIVTDGRGGCNVNVDVHNRTAPLMRICGSATLRPKWQNLSVPKTFGTPSYKPVRGLT